MRIPKVLVLYKEDARGACKDTAKEIVKVFSTAAQILGQQIEIEMSRKIREFGEYQFKEDDLPILIVNKKLVFKKNVPPIEYVKQLIRVPKDGQSF